MCPLPLSGANYTGQCHPGTSRLNDRLAWLWNESTALYPSIYLPRRLAGTPEVSPGPLAWTRLAS